MNLPLRKIIGTCSVCHGRVEEQGYGNSPKCIDCGAVRKNAHGPLIPMVPETPQQPFRWYQPVWTNPYQPVWTSPCITTTGTEPPPQTWTITCSTNTGGCCQ